MTSTVLSAEKTLTLVRCIHVVPPVERTIYSVRCTVPLVERTFNLHVYGTSCSEGTYYLRCVLYCLLLGYVPLAMCRYRTVLPSARVCTACDLQYLLYLLLSLLLRWIRYLLHKTSCFKDMYCSAIGSTIYPALPGR